MRLGLLVWVMALLWPQDILATDMFCGECDERRLSERELSALSYDELRIMHQSIFARHGKIFDQPEYSRIFNRMGWYRPSPETTKLSDIEQANVALLKVLEHRALELQNRMKKIWIDFLHARGIGQDFGSRTGFDWHELADIRDLDYLKGKAVHLVLRDRSGTLSYIRADIEGNSCTLTQGSYNWLQEEVEYDDIRGDSLSDDTLRLAREEPFESVIGERWAYDAEQQKYVFMGVFVAGEG